MKTYTIALAVIKYRSRYLIAKHPDRRLNPGRWEFLYAMIGGEEPAEDAVLNLVLQKTGLKGKVTKSSDPYVIKTDVNRWIVIPFIVEMFSDRLKADPSYAEMKWVSVSELEEYEDIVDVEMLKKKGLL